MKQLTVRGFDDELEKEIRRLAESEDISLNKAALRLMRRGAGLTKGRSFQNSIGVSLDHLAGTWSEEEARLFAACLPLKVSRSLRIGFEDLNLDAAFVVHAGVESFPLADRVQALAASRIWPDLDVL